MAFIASGDSPEAFLRNHFREKHPVSIAAGTPMDRIPMIPLLLAPHHWKILDANIGMLSTRYATQNSCMGLYPRYNRLCRERRGTWFAARTDQGHVIALSTVQLLDPGCAQVDGFAHEKYSHCCEGVVRTGLRWATTQGTSTAQASVSVEDQNKVSFFESLGFRQVGRSDEFDLGPRRVASVHLQKSP